MTQAKRFEGDVSSDDDMRRFNSLPKTEIFDRSEGDLGSQVISFKQYQNDISENDDFPVKKKEPLSPLMKYESLIESRQQ